MGSKGARPTRALDIRQAFVPRRRARNTCSLRAGNAVIVQGLPHQRDMSASFVSRKAVQAKYVLFWLKLRWSV